MAADEELRVDITGDNSRLKRALRESESSMKRLGGVGRKAMAGLAVGAAAATVAVGASVKQFATFETGVAKVNTLLGDNEAASKKAADAAKQMSAEMGTAGGSAEILEAQYQALSAGAEDIDAANKLVEQSVKLAKGGFTDTTTAVDGLTTVMNSYSLGAEEATRVSDVFLATQNAGKTTVGELAGAVGRITPIANQMGISFEEVGASLATITARGVATNEATTSLQQTMQGFLKPTSQMKDRLEELGFASGEAAVEQLGLIGATQAVTDGMSASEQASLFNVEALKAVANISGDASEAATENLEKMEDAAGSTEEAFEEMSDTAETKFQKLKNTVQNVMIDVGAAVAPALLAIANALGPLIEKLAPVIELIGDALADAIKDALPFIEDLVDFLGEVLKVIIDSGLLDAILEVASSLGRALLPALKALLPGILAVAQALSESLLKVMPKLEPIIEELAGELGEALAEALVAVAPLIVILADVLVLVLDAAGPLIDILLDLVSVALRPLGPAIGFISEVIGVLADWLGTLVGAVRDAMSPLDDLGAKADAVGGKFEDFRRGLAIVWDAVVEKFRSAWETIKTVVDAATSFVKDNIDKFSGAVMLILAPFLAAAALLFSTSWEDIRSTISQKTAAIRDRIGSVFDSIKQTLTEWTETVKTLFSNAWSFLKTLFFESTENVRATVSEKFEAIRSTLFTWKDTVQTMFSNFWSAAKTLFRESAENVRSTVAEKFEAIRANLAEWRDKVVGIMQNLWTKTKEIFSNAYGAMKEVGKDIGRGIRDGINDMWDEVTGKAKALWNATQEIIKKGTTGFSKAAEKAREKGRSAMGLSNDKPSSSGGGGGIPGSGSGDSSGSAAAGIRNASRGGGSNINFASHVSSSQRAAVQRGAAAGNVVARNSKGQALGFTIKKAAHGANMMVRRPTLFLTGEAGPEHVAVTPTRPGMNQNGPKGGLFVHIERLVVPSSGGDPQRDAKALVKALMREVEFEARYGTNSWRGGGQ